MTVADLINQDPNPGDGQRDLAARLLSFRYGAPKIEHRSEGKKVDTKFVINEFGKNRILYVESKEYGRPLGRSDVVDIYADYLGILERSRPSSLLLVTKSGLTADAQSYVDVERFDLAHQTIWELENEILGLTEYTRHLVGLFDEDGLKSYYLETTAKSVNYDENDHEVRIVSDEREQLFSRIDTWIQEPGAKPIAILGGYGAGKSSFAKRISSHYASLALESTDNRIPILVKLGGFSRFSSIENMIGGMFASEFNVPNFNIHLFLDSVARGRFLIICDGFDEMKHAMSWTDFRATVSEINKLSQGDSKLILLGRPNAFMSTDEHLQVLQGRRRIGVQYRRLTDWPEFEEWELSEFNSVEQVEFIRKYLSYSVSKKLDSKSHKFDLNERVARVAELAASEPDIFSKPVHAQILTDLGSDLEFDLNSLGGRISRWDLYQYFFSHLVERESRKAARRPVSDESRLDFLREIAFWLFSKKSGLTSFSALDIPARIIDDIDLDDTEDPEIRLREYLTGAFLEKKSADIFYFGHRSFAEFLVADRMIRNNPSSTDHGVYAKLVAGSVRDFFEEGLGDQSLDVWADTFDCENGLIDLEYVRFLSAHCGNFRQARSHFPKNSNSRLIFDCFNDSFHFGPVLERRLMKAATERSAGKFFLCLRLIDISMSKRSIDKRGDDSSVLYELARAVASNESLTREAFRLDTIKREITVDGVKLRAMVSETLEALGLEISDGRDKPVSEGWPSKFTAEWTNTYGSIVGKKKFRWGNFWQNR